MKKKHLEVLIEEPSMEAALISLLPRILPAECTFNLHAFAGKKDLLRKLPSRLRAYRSWLPPDSGIVVIIDQDASDCRSLKNTLEAASRHAGFATKSSSQGQEAFEVLNRIAIEELEAWLFGDTEALVAAFPRLPRTLSRQSKYRDPDHVAGGAWESLERLLQRHGYYSAGMPKIEVARAVSEHMDPARNRSHSFKVFRSGLLSLVDASE